MRILILIGAIAALTFTAYAAHNIVYMCLPQAALTSMTHAVWLVPTPCMSIHGQELVMVPSARMPLYRDALLTSQCYKLSTSIASAKPVTRRRHPTYVVTNLYGYINIIECMYGVEIHYTSDYISNYWVESLLLPVDHLLSKSNTVLTHLDYILSTYERHGIYPNGDVLTKQLFLPIAVLRDNDVYLTGVLVFPTERILWCIIVTFGAFVLLLLACIPIGWMIKRWRSNLA